MFAAGDYSALAQERPPVCALGSEVRHELGTVNPGIGMSAIGDTVKTVPSSLDDENRRSFPNENISEAIA